MKQNSLFSGQEADFEKTCGKRILAGKLIFLLGALAILASVLYGRNPALAARPGAAGIGEFYLVMGAALMAASLVRIARTRRYLRDPELKKKKFLEENDERNRLIGLKSWAFSGYAMYLLLYVGVLVSGFVNMTVARVLMAVTAAFALLLLTFRVVISRRM